MQLKSEDGLNMPHPVFPNEYTYQPWTEYMEGAVMGGIWK